MQPPLLSILTPACWERVEQARALTKKIAAQITPPWAVEHLVLYDNRHRSVGLKRQSLLDSARGKFIAFVDDDDDVSDDYVVSLLHAIAKHPEAEVITFDEAASYNGKPFTVHFEFGAKDQDLLLDGPDDQVITRGPWHVCAWRREKIRHCQFLDCNFGEDAAWVKQARQHITRAHHIPRILHHYRHDARTTLAPENNSSASTALTDDGKRCARCNASLHETEKTYGCIMCAANDKIQQTCAAGGST